MINSFFKHLCAIKKKKGKVPDNVLTKEPKIHSAYNYHSIPKSGDLITINVPKLPGKQLYKLSWLVDIDNEVKAGQIIAELESDLAIMEVETIFDGRILWINEDTQYVKELESMYTIQVQ